MANLDSFEPIQDSDDQLIALSGRDKEKLTFREIALRAIENCRIEGSKEMVRGGEVTIIYHNQPVRITKPDQRKIYFEVIDSLYDLFDYFIKKEQRKWFEDLEKEILKLHNKLLQSYINSERKVHLKHFAKQNNMFPREADVYLQYFYDNKLPLYRKKFRLLLKVFKESNELKSVTQIKAY